MRNSITSSTSDEIQSSDQIQSKVLILDTSTANANALFNDVSGSSDSPHGDMVGAFNLEATPSDASVVQTNEANLGLTTTATGGLTSVGTETVEAHQAEEANGSPFESA